MILTDAELDELEAELNVYESGDQRGVSDYATVKASTRQIRALLSTVRELRRLLGLDSRWPLNDVLRELMKGVTILQDHCNYDGEGYEIISHAYDAARIIRDQLDAALAPPAPASPAEREGEGPLSRIMACSGRKAAGGDL